MNYALSDDPTNAMRPARSARGGFKSDDASFERRFGRIENEIEHQSNEVAQHSTALKELLADRRSIKQRLEALERDLKQIPKDSEQVQTLKETLATLATRVKRLEEQRAVTRPPRRVDHQDNETSTSTKPPGRGQSGQRPDAGGDTSFLDSFF